MKNNFLFILDEDGVSQDLTKDREKAVIAPIFSLYTSDFGIGQNKDEDNTDLLQEISGILARDIVDRYENSNYSIEYTGRLINNQLKNKIFYETDFYEHGEYDVYKYDVYKSKVFIVVDFETEQVFSLASDIDGNYHENEIKDKSFIDEIIEHTERYKYIDPDKMFKEQFRETGSSLSKP